MDKNSARERAWMLYNDLARITDRDAEQEVSGIAVPVLEAMLQACKEFAADDPVVKAIDGLITPDSIESGSLRAVDASLVVHQLAAALGPERRSHVASPVGRFPPPNPVDGF